MPEIHFVDHHFHSSDVIASFVVPSAAGPIVIETGPHSTYERLVTGLNQLGYAPGEVKHILVTHIHFDHAGGAWALAKAGGATVYVHPKGYKHLANPEKLYNSAKQIYGAQMETLWGRMEPIPEAQLVSLDTDGATLPIAEHSFRVWHSPGHAKHHVAFQLEDQLFTGDVGGVVIDEVAVEPPLPPPDIDLEAWQESIRKLKPLEVNALWLTHFGKVSEPQKHWQALEDVLARRAGWMKEQLQAGKTPDELASAYDALVAERLKAAGATAEQMEKYQLANPAFMSVYGLARYWKKRWEREAAE